MKKYRLKRTYESPNCTIPAGTIGEWTASGQTLMFENAGCPIGWDVSIVKRNPDWFEEVKEEQVDPYYDAVLLSIDKWRRGTTRIAADALKENYVVTPKHNPDLIEGLRVNKIVVKRLLCPKGFKLENHIEDGMWTLKILPE